tara:strand:+ start:2142 stop:3410 length:1269 start_codon:yes stop_codon:yes gene_type:complete
MNIDDVLEQWTDVFCEYSYNNERYAQLCLHLVLGQIYKNRFIIKGSQRIDGRINIAAFWDASGGKSAPYGFVRDMLMSAGKDVRDLDDFTDAALIGTWRQAEDADEEDEAEGGLILEPGIMQLADVIHFDEASTLFMETQHTKKAINFLEKALNPIGSAHNLISKKLASGPAIEFHSDLSLYLTTYIPENIGQEFLNKGLMQRTLVLPKRLNFAQRVDNLRTDVDKLGRQTVTPEQYEAVRSTIVTLHRQEVLRQNEEYYDLDWDPTREFVKNRAVRLLMMTEKLDAGVQSVATSLIARYTNFMYVIAMHSACIGGRRIVTKSDVEYAYEFIRTIMEHVLPWLEMDSGITRKDAKNEKLRNQLRKISQKLESSEDGYVLKSKLWETAENELKISQPTLYRQTKDADWMSETTKGRRKYVLIE